MIFKKNKNFEQNWKMNCNMLAFWGSVSTILKKIKNSSTSKLAKYVLGRYYLVANLKVWIEIGSTR